MSSAERPGRISSSVGGCGGGEVEGVRSSNYEPIKVDAENMEKPTCCRSGLLLATHYRARVDIVVRVGMGIQHPLPFGRPGMSGLNSGCRSTFQPG